MVEAGTKNKTLARLIDSKALNVNSLPKTNNTFPLAIEGCSLAKVKGTGDSPITENLIVLTREVLVVIPKPNCGPVLSAVDKKRPPSMNVLTKPRDGNTNTHLSHPLPVDPRLGPISESDNAKSGKSTE